MDQLEVLKRWIGESSRVVFFGGAGVSTEYATWPTVIARLNPGFDPGYCCSINVYLFDQ